MDTVEKRPLPTWVSILLFVAIMALVMIIGMMI
jgi:hypothetical protein